MSISTLIAGILAVLFIALMYSIQAGGISNAMDDLWDIISVDQSRGTETGSMRIQQGRAIDEGNAFLNSVRMVSDIEDQDTCFAAIETIDQSLLGAGYIYELKASSEGMDFRLKKYNEDDRGDLNNVEGVGSAISVEGVSPCVVGGERDAAFFIDILEGEKSMVDFGSQGFGTPVESLTIHGGEGGIFSSDSTFLEFENSAQTERFDFDANSENPYLVILKKGDDICFIESESATWFKCTSQSRITDNCFRGSQDSLPAFLSQEEFGSSYICEGSEDRFEQLKSN